MKAEYLNKAYDTDRWKELVRWLFPSEADMFSTPHDLEVDHQRIKSFLQLGTVQLSDELGSELALFEIILRPGTTRLEANRVALNSIVDTMRRRTAITGALAVFVDDDKSKWRFSYIAQASTFDRHGNEVELGTKDLKRYTYVLGENEQTLTAWQRFKHLADIRSKRIEDLTEAFSVERISKEFFTKYQEHYKRFCEHLYDLPEAESKFEGKNEKERQKHMRDFVKKLMGQIVFMYFLQKKGWLGCKLDTKEWVGGEQNFIERLLKDNPDQAHFYSNTLTKLLFKTLNNENRNEIYLTPWGENVRIPYLNGGLFTNENSRTDELDFPSEYFHSLFDFFGQYNFTVDESSPNDHEVGIDPEMLGHIFESLLEDNKDKGAFYTPKEIVHYMCQESLLQYLSFHIPNFDNEALSKFVRYKVLTDEVAVQKVKIEKLLKDIKICDPAIGSGAFPMGLVHEIFHCLILLAPDSNYVDLKKSIIQNSIYGVDKDKGAVDIARLRCWLAIVVDEKQPEPLPNLDYKIIQGDSLLESYEGFDLSDLLDAKKEEDEPKPHPRHLFDFAPEMKLRLEGEDKDNLEKWLEDYYESSRASEKDVLQSKIDKIFTDAVDKIISEYKRDFEEKKTEVERNIARTQELKKEIPAKVSKELQRLDTEILLCDEKQKRLKGFLHIDERPYLLWHTWFKKVFENGGFDIVIANPPYLRVQEIERIMPELKPYYEKKYQVAKGSYDLANLFFELAINLLKPNATGCFIFPHKFFNSDSTAVVRDYMLEGRYMDKIAHFGANRVFESVDTYVCVALFSNQQNDGIRFQRFPFQSDWQHLMLNDSRYHLIPYSTIKRASQLYGANQWILFDQNEELEIFETIYHQEARIENKFSRVFQGIATGKDDLYVFTGNENEEWITGKFKNSDELNLEPSILKPFIRGRDIHRYSRPEKKAFILFPYKFDENGIATVYEEKEIELKFPNAYLWLKQNENEHRKKDKGSTNDNYWYRYARKQGIEGVELPKLSSMEICSVYPNVILDEQGFYHTTTIYSWIKSGGTKESYEYLLSIANSRLLWWFLKRTGDTLQGDARRFKTNYLNPFPLPKSIDPNHDFAIATLVKYIIFLSDNSMPKANPSVSNSAISSFLNDVIDGCVCELYFEEHMRKKGIDVLSFVKRDVEPIEQKKSLEEKAALINSVFQKWQKPENEIRNRLKLFATRSPEILGIIWNA